MNFIFRLPNESSSPSCTRTSAGPVAGRPMLRGKHPALRPLIKNIVGRVHDHACAGRLAYCFVSARVVGMPVRVDDIAEFYALFPEMLYEVFFISGRVDQDALFRLFVVDQVAEDLHETDRNLLNLHRFLQIGPLRQNYYNRAKMNQLHQKVKWAEVGGRIKRISDIRYPIAGTTQSQKHYIEFKHYEE